MRRHEASRPTEIPVWILRQQWQTFDGEESTHRQDAWETAWRRWAREHGLPAAEVQDAIAEEAGRLLAGGR